MRAPVIGDAWNDYRRFVESASVKRAVRNISDADMHTYCASLEVGCLPAL